MCGLSHLVEDQGDGLFGLAACTLKKGQPGTSRTGQSHWGQVSFSRNLSLVCYTCGGEHNPELCHVIPEVRDFLAELDYAERMDRLRECEAKGEDTFFF